MPAYAIKPMLIAIAVTVWLKFLLPATGSLFQYEMSLKEDCVSTMK